MGDRFTEDEVRLIIEFCLIPARLESGLSILIHGVISLYYVILRDYLTVFWLSPEVSTGDPIISSRALA